MSGSELPWCLVVPVKRLALAKTRLEDLAGDRRPDLALAFALDTVGAALDCAAVAAVVVVTDDEMAGPALSDLGAIVVPDVPDAGLNPALRYGAKEAAARHPRNGVGALSADLPALRPAELERALAAAESHPAAFVPDVAGTGTTLLVARPEATFNPEFGARSRARHRAAGAVELDLTDVPTLRRDVDTEVDLYDAERLGLGARTAVVVAAIRSTRPASAR